MSYERVINDRYFSKTETSEVFDKSTRSEMNRENGVNAEMKERM